MTDVTIYTDGACINNPGPGGYGIVMKTKVNDIEHRKELSQGYIHTTNNRMELMAVAVALETLKNLCNVDLYSDSKYVVDGIENGWAETWKKHGWSKKKGKIDRPSNIDLWKRILDAIAAHNLKCHWVKGHSGILENERCDFLALNAAKGDLIQDVIDDGIADTGSLF